MQDYNSVTVVAHWAHWRPQRLAVTQMVKVTVVVTICATLVNTHTHTHTPAAAELTKQMVYKET